MNPKKNPKLRRNNPSLNQDSLRLFIGGVKLNTTNQDLFKHFAQFGNIHSAKINRDSRTGHSKGYGFITCGDAQTKWLILQRVHKIKGKVVDVKLPIPKAISKDIKIELYSRKIYIPNLEFEISEEDLSAYFKRFGQVKKVYKVIDTLHNFKKKSIVYVEFANPVARERVIAQPVHIIRNYALNCKRYSPAGWMPVLSRTDKRQRRLKRKRQNQQKRNSSNFFVEFNGCVEPYEGFTRGTKLQDPVEYPLDGDV